MRTILITEDDPRLMERLLNAGLQGVGRALR